jgi:hypothetical protein
LFAHGEKIAAAKGVSSVERRGSRGEGREARVELK